MPTTNYIISPSDGWVQIATAGATFTRVSAHPHTHPYYIFEGSAAPSLTASQGSGVVTFSVGVPTAGQTITIGSETYTWRAAASLPFEVTIGGTNLISATNFTTIVNAQSTLVRAVNGGTGGVTLTSYAQGTSGNYAFSTNASNVAVNGATFTGGAAVQRGVEICHKPYCNNTQAQGNLYARVPNPASSASTGSGGIRLDVLTENSGSTPVIPFTNAAAGTSASFTLPGGLYSLTAKATWGALVMNVLGPDGVTYLSVSQVQTADGGQVLYLAPGTYQIVTTGGSNYYVAVTRIV